MNNMSNVIRISFDVQTLLDYKVDQKVYQDRLAAALPNHRLEFSYAPPIRDSIYVTFAISIVGGENPKLVFDAAKAIWPHVRGTSVQHSENCETVGRVQSDSD